MVKWSPERLDLLGGKSGQLSAEVIVVNNNRGVKTLGKVPQKIYIHLVFLGCNGENYTSRGDVKELVNPISCKVESSKRY